MENERQPPENNAEASERDNIINEIPAPDANISYFIFHEGFMKGSMSLSTIEHRIHMVRSIRAQLIEQMDNIRAMQDKMEELIDRYAVYAKSAWLDLARL